MIKFDYLDFLVFIVPVLLVVGATYDLKRRLAKTDNIDFSLFFKINYLGFVFALFFMLCFAAYYCFNKNISFFIPSVLSNIAIVIFLLWFWVRKRITSKHK